MQKSFFLSFLRSSIKITNCWSFLKGLKLTYYLSDDVAIGVDGVPKRGLDEPPLLLMDGRHKRPRYEDSGG
jgi:hypothetical protein